MKERLQKVMAQAGVASRRKCEEMIRQGRVAVNGLTVTELGTKVDPERDVITVDGRQIKVVERNIYIALHKPPGVITTARDPWGRPTVLDLVDVDTRVYPVGRLDADSEGLILLTNDGVLAHQLTHPSFEHEKEYHVLVSGRPSGEALERLRSGVPLEDGVTAPARVDVLRRESGDTWLRIVLREGRKRQIRRMAEAIGGPVRRLIRVRIGPIRLGGLEPGLWRHLSPGEVRQLRQVVRETNTQKVSELEGHKPQTIAIDGPAAAGKSTIGKAIAERLNYRYLDTGAMYRAVTWVALQRHVDIQDEPAVTALAEAIDIDITAPTNDDGRQYTVFVDGQDVTWALRRPEVDANVSTVSAYPGVRHAMVVQQRKIAGHGRAVVVGRDIGTVVLPDADLKIYLDASVEERARRRYLERVERGEKADYEAILRDMRRRDQLDSSRATAPLRPAADAIIVNTDGLSVKEAISTVMDVVCRDCD